MAELSIPEDLLRRLTAQANALNLSVEDYIVPKLELIAEYARPLSEGPQPLTGEAWKRERDAWRREAEARASRYPPGFQLDDSRETMYFGRDETEP